MCVCVCDSQCVCVYLQCSAVVVQCVQVVSGVEEAAATLFGAALQSCQEGGEDTAQQEEKRTEAIATHMAAISTDEVKATEKGGDR